MDMFKSFKLSTLVIAFISMLALSSHAQALILVEIPGIPGESTVPGFEGLIAADSASASFELNSCDSIDINKVVDKATPLLIAAAVGGTSFPGAKIFFVNADEGGKQQILLSLALKNVVIGRVSMSGDADDQPTEDVSLIAQGISIKYQDGKIVDLVCGGKKSAK